MPDDLLVRNVRPRGGATADIFISKGRIAAGTRLIDRPGSGLVVKRGNIVARDGVAVSAAA